MATVIETPARSLGAGGAPGYRDLRDWMDTVAQWGELEQFDGVDWNLDMGGIVDTVYRYKKNPPAVLFDNIKDYPEGYRVLFGILGSPRRLAYSLRMDWRGDMMEFIRAYRDRVARMQPIAPIEVDDGPVMECVQEGSDVDLLKFPVPRHNALDGGRFFGTGHATITRDPDSGWVNLGTYRHQLQDAQRIGYYATPGKHGDIHRKKAHERGEPFPVAVALGIDPSLWAASTVDVPLGMSEYDYAGALKQEPLRVMKGPRTGLPIPVDAEIVVEGEILPGDTEMEGPFGEWPGYFAGGGRPAPVMRVKAVYHRRNPIFTASQTAKPPVDSSFYRAVLRSAILWQELERAGVQDVRGVWCHEAGGSRLFNIISIKQRYAGHARQVAQVASGTQAGAYMNRFTIVTDEDIDPSNTYDVLWALSTRADPATDIDILRRTWSSKLDPLVHPSSTAYFNSRAIIDACKPYEWRDEFPAVATTDAEHRKRLIEKYGSRIAD